MAISFIFGRPKIFQKSLDGTLPNKDLCDKQINDNHYSTKIFCVRKMIKSCIFIKHMHRGAYMVYLNYDHAATVPCPEISPPMPSIDACPDNLNVAAVPFSFLL